MGNAAQQKDQFVKSPGAIFLPADPWNTSLCWLIITFHFKRESEGQLAAWSSFAAFPAKPRSCSLKSRRRPNSRVSVQAWMYIAGFMESLVLQLCQEKGYLHVRGIWGRTNWPQLGMEKCRELQCSSQEPRHTLSLQGNTQHLAEIRSKGRHGKLFSTCCCHHLQC